MTASSASGRMRYISGTSAVRLFVVIGVTAVLLLGTSFSATASAGINTQLNFQGKLTNTNGTNVADGTYNLRFKIYQDGDGDTSTADETLKWTETRISTDKVQVTNGVFRVSLGAVTAFGTNVDWNQNTLWLSITVGGTGTPSWDTEMNPLIRMTSVPYAFNAQKVNGLTVTNTSDNSFSSATTLKIGDGKTVIVNNTMTFSGTDGQTFTFPTATDTIVGLAASQVLTNKSIGSTGLTFAGAATDITTSAGEDLTFTAGTTGVISLNDTVKISTLANQYGIVYQSDSVGTLASLANGGSGGLCLLSQSSAAPQWGSCSGTATTWNTIGAPAGNLSLSMGAYTSLFTYGATTGTNNLFKLTDTASNTGTGYLMDLTTAASSTLKPFHVSAAGIEALTVLASGNVGIGTTAPGATFEISPAITAVGGATTYAVKQTPTLSGAINSAQTANYGRYNVPTINLSGGSSNTLTNLYATYVGLTANAGTVSTWYANYVAAPTGAGTVSNKYAFVSEGGAGNVGIGTTAPTATLQVKNATNALSEFQVQKAGTGNEVLFNLDSLSSNTNNLLSNGSIESAISGNWALKGSATVTQDSTQTYMGTYSLKIATTTTNDGAKQNVSLSSSTTYTLGLYVQVPSTLSSMSTFEVGRSEDGSTDTSCLTNQTVPRNGWAHVVCSFTTGTTSGTTYIYVRQTDDTARSAGIFIDGVTLETDTNSSTAYREGKAQLNAVLTTPLTLLNAENSQTAFQVLTSRGASIFGVDTTDANLVAGYAGFEPNTQQWSYFGAATGSIVRDSTASYTGTYSLKVTTTTTAGDGAKLTFGSTIPSLTASTTYTLSWFDKLVSGSAFTDIAAVYSPDGTVTVACTPTNQTVVTGGFTRRSCTFSSGVTTPTTSAYILIKQTGAPAVARVFNIDSIQLEPGATVTGYGGGSISLNASVQSPLSLRNMTDSNAAFQIYNAGNTALFTADTLNGNIGIGTSTPTEKLEVSGGNVKIGAQSDATGTLTNINTSTTAGSYGSQTLIDGAYSSATYNGKVYVATKETDLAAVYRYDGANIWTKVTDTTSGKVITGDTANIDAMVLTPYNGKLYAGTQTGSATNTGSVYAYDGTTWTLQNATRGTFGAEASVDGVTDIHVWNGRLYMASQEPNAGSLYRYDGSTTWTRLNTTIGKGLAEATADIDGGVLISYNGKLWWGVQTGSTTARMYIYEPAVANGFVLVNTTAGTLAAGTTLQPDISSFAVYNGQLFVGTAGTNIANIYIYKGGITGTTSGADMFFKTTTTTGRIDATNDATDIDGVKAMKPYNGRLYAGSSTSSTGNLGALYEYTGISTSTTNGWTLVGARGTFGSQTGVDMVDSLIELNGTLYIGTEESNAGSVYSWTKTVGNSYALRFDGGNSQYGAISFVGSQQAQDNSNHAGTFLFSNAIWSTTGAFDYAEDYPTMDTSLEAGEVVAVDTQNKEYIKRAEGADSLVGIISERPGFELSLTDEDKKGKHYVPVALVGRVPVKVSTENGAIKAGDSLTLSSEPGIAMRATKASQVIGKALEDYSGGGVSKILVYVNISTTLGNSEAAYGILNTALSTDILTAMLDPKSASLSGLSVVTDRVFAGAEVVSPRITTQDIFTKTVTAFPNADLTLSIGKDHKIIFQGKDKTTPAVTIDADGNALFAGTITAKKIRVEQIEGLDVLNGTVLNLKTLLSGIHTSSRDVSTASQAALMSRVLSHEGVLTSLSVDGLATVSAGLRVKGDGLFEGMITIVDTLTTKNFIVTGIADFFNSVIFHKNVEVKGVLTMNNDAAGFAVVKKGQHSIAVTFDAAYDTQPIVAANVSTSSLTDDAYVQAVADGRCVATEGKESCQENVDEQILAANIQYLVTRASKTGFTILVKNTFDRDVIFSWTAFVVKNAKTAQVQERTTFLPFPTVIQSASDSGKEVSQ